MILLGDSLLKGNGMVSDPSEKKRTNIFLKSNPLSALENSELFLLADTLIFPKKEGEPTPYTSRSPPEMNLGFS